MMTKGLRLVLLAVAGLGVVAACATQVRTETTEPPTTATRPVGPPATSPPTTAPAPDLLSDAEIRQLLPNTPVTTAPPGAVYALVAERQQFAVECFREAGFAAELDPADNSVVVDVPDEQWDIYWEVSTRCREREFAEFGIEVEQDFTKMFRAFLWVRQCMLENGYEVSRPPSLEVFVESHGSAWHPYDAVMAEPTFTMEQSQELEQICPQDLTYLYQVLDFGPRPAA